MNTLIICLVVVALLPYLAKTPVVMSLVKLPEGYDNHYQRLQQSKLQGFGARAVAAHQNAFEALIVFSSAVLLAIATHHTSSMMQVLAVTYVASRLVYHAAYLLDLASLRSIVWLMGLVIALSMMLFCL